MNDLLYSVLNSLGYKVFALQAPQNEKLPYAIYTLVDQQIDVCASGSTDLEDIMYQLDVYSTNYGECKTIVGEMLAAIEAATEFKTVLYSISDSKEDTGKVFRSQCDFNLWRQDNGV